MFWDWAITNLVASLFPSRAPHEYPYFGIIKSGEVSNVLGVGRIRQIRLKKGNDLLLFRPLFYLGHFHNELLHYFLILFVSECRIILHRHQ